MQCNALRPLTGRDEEFLIEEGPRLLPAARANALLGRCLDEGGLDAVRGMAFGKREELLLRLRSLTFGDRLACVLTCPDADCAARMDAELSVADLLRRAPAPSDTLEAAVAAPGGRWAARFRLPTAGDVELGAEAALQDPEAAAELVMRRCLIGMTRDGVETTVSRLPEELANAVEERMLEADPHAATVLDATCPECGSRFRVVLDPADFLFRELAGRRHELFGEVHSLALQYHWSESEILGMTRTRRRLYLELLAEATGEA